MGFRIIVITPKWESTDRSFVDNGVKVYTIYKGPILRGTIHWYISKLPIIGKLFALVIREIEWSVAVFLKLKKIIKKESVDIIETTETGNLFLSYFNKPIILRAHADFYARQLLSGERVWLGARLAWSLQKYFMKMSKFLITPSDFQMKWMIKELRYYSSNKMVIPNYIHPMLTKRRENKILDDDTISLLYTGRIEKIKGIFELLDALEIIISNNSSITLTIAGSFSHSITEKEFLDQVTKRKLNNNINYLGYVDINELAEVYINSTLFIMPSYFETFCISIAEAMYFGLPVIATNVGGVPSVLDHNKNGILIEKGDSDLLAKSIIDLLKQPGKMEMFSKEGKNKAMSTFTLQSVVEKSINIYNLL